LLLLILFLILPEVPWIPQELKDYLEKERFILGRLRLVKKTLQYKEPRKQG